MLALPPRARAWLVAYAVVAVAQVAGELSGVGVLAWGGLVLAMPLLAAALVASGRHRTRLGRWVLVGFGFSWLGDVLGFAILIKIAFFLLAQICYGVAFWPYRRSIGRHPWVLLGYAAVVAALVVLIGRESGALVPAIIVYGSALGAMAVLATGLNRVAGLGGAVFVVSDSVIGIDTFVGSVHVPQAGAVIMVSYLAAQALLLGGVLLGRREQRPSTHPAVTEG